MGSGRSSSELTCRAKKPRERKRREKTQRKRLISLGLPASAVEKLNSRQVRQLLGHPKKLMKKATSGDASR